MQAIKLAVIGSRTFTDYKLLCLTLDKYEISAIVSGGADGADSLGQRYAKDKGLKILIIYPNWNKDGKSAGFKRNREIIEKCDKVVAFWQNDSKGTANSISIAKELNKEVEVIKC
jgi:predicted Rossmann fold nucleotide-binding protein DprA/Smf involved in DNA uptake